jgi:hypothetical protein
MKRRLLALLCGLLLLLTACGNSCGGTASCTFDSPSMPSNPNTYLEDLYGDPGYAGYPYSAGSPTPTNGGIYPSYPTPAY